VLDVTQAEQLDLMMFRLRSLKRLRRVPKNRTLKTHLRELFVYGNLGIERPDLTIEEVRRALVANRPRGR
jgi:hypothetical protein